MAVLMITEMFGYFGTLNCTFQKHFLYEFAYFSDEIID